MVKSKQSALGRHADKMLGTLAMASVLGLAGTANAAAFTPGNLVIYRVGDGTQTLVNSGNSVFLDEYTPAGGLVQSIALPTAVSGSNNALIASGTSTSEGLLTRSVDGQSIFLTGYSRALGAGTTSLSGTTATAVPRTVGRVDAAGTVNTTTALTDLASSNNPRTVISTDSTNFYAAGGAGGVRFAAIGATTSTQITAAPANIRQLNIFGGNLYGSSGATGFRLFQVGSGLPTATGQTSTNLPGISTTTGSPYAFVLLDLSAAVAGLDTLYVADDGTATGVTAGIQKYSLVDGSFVQNGTTITAAAARGLTASVSGTTVSLFATTGGSTATGGGTLYSVTDTAGYNAAPSTAAAATIATATANTAFRGVAFAPAAAAPAADTTGALISEFRFRGLASATDEYIEILNLTDRTLNITGWQVQFTSGAATQTVIVAGAPGAAVTIPPRGHYLVANSTGYSLTPAANQTFTADGDDTSGVTLLNAQGGPVDSAAAGDAPNVNAQFAFVRTNRTPGTAVDRTGTNAGSTTAAFRLVATSINATTVGATGDTIAGTSGALPATLGAPGPENTGSPVLRDDLLPATVVDPANPASNGGVNGGLNRERRSTETSASAPFGTIILRRTITNNTGQPITAIRFRAVKISTANGQSSNDSRVADVRLLSSTNETVTLTGGGTRTVLGTTLETPSTEPPGGGVNSSVVEGTLILGTALPSAPGASGTDNTRSYSFRLGVVKTGSFFVNLSIEALPGPTPAP